MQWTDQIRRVKIFLVLAAVIIAVASLVVSHILIRDLAREEHNKMAVWAEAMRTLNNADENTDINLVLKVINGNNTIPVIVLDSNGDVQAYRTINEYLQAGSGLRATCVATRQGNARRASGDTYRA